MTKRRCFPCKACCEGWLKAEIDGQLLKPGTPCIHVTDQGCSFYENRPATPCASFKCGWLSDPVRLPEHMNPAKCGAIVLLGRKWHGRDVIRVAPTGEKIPGDTLEWLMAFSREQSVPLIFSENIFKNGEFIGKKRTGFGPPSFIYAVETEVEPEDIFKL